MQTVEGSLFCVRMCRVYVCLRMCMYACLCVCATVAGSGGMDNEASKPVRLVPQYTPDQAAGLPEGTMDFIRDAVKSVRPVSFVSFCLFRLFLSFASFVYGLAPPYPAADCCRLHKQALASFPSPEEFTSRDSLPCGL